MIRYLWHRARGHQFALRAPCHVVCLTDLTVMIRPVFRDDIHRREHDHAQSPGSG